MKVACVLTFNVGVIMIWKATTSMLHINDCKSKRHSLIEEVKNGLSSFSKTHAFVFTMLGYKMYKFTTWYHTIFKCVLL